MPSDIYSSRRGRAPFKQAARLVLLTVKGIALQRGTTAGNVVSSLLRESLQPKSFQVEYRNGVPVLPRRANAPVVTSELVNRLRDEDE